MVRRLTAVLLAAALVLLSPGLDAGRAFAAVTVGRVATPLVAVSGVAGAVALPQLSASLTARSLTAPASAPLPTILAAPVLRPLDVAAPRPAHSVPPAAHDAPRSAVAVPALAETLAPALEAAADERAGASADRSNAQTISDVITGQRSIEAAAETAVLGSPAAFRSVLSAPADAPVGPKVAPEAPKTAPIKVVASARRYAFTRYALAKIAQKTGAVHSLPAAGPALIDRAMASAADTRLVISDFDDTLAAYNQTLSPEMIEAIRAVKAAGKHFVVISDRGDEKRAHQLSVFESLETLPVELRAGMYVAANAGGRVYLYDAQGVPQRVYELPALSDERKALVSAAAEATKTRMQAEFAVEQHVPSATNNNPSESWNTYGYAMMLKVGANEKQVRGAAAILQQELAKQGIEAEVKPRFAKDPANPPYINFSIVTKQPATAYIAKALGATAKDVVVVGDSMYDPREAKPELAGGKLDKLAERLSGRALPKTGNATDHNMEKALPGVLTIAVGHNADPRMSNAWVTGVKGPEATRRLLLSVASRKAGAPKSGEGLQFALSALGLVALVAAVGTAGYFMLSAFTEVVLQGERSLRDFYDLDGLMMLGAAGLALGSLKTVEPQGDKKEDPAAKTDEEKPLPKWERVAIGVLLPIAVVGALYLWYMLYAGIGTLPSTPMDVPPGWQGLFPSGGWENLFQSVSFGGALAGAGAAGTMIRRDLGPVGTHYKDALRSATDIARNRGIAADRVLFIRATSVIPGGSRQWDYEFALARPDGAYDIAIVYTDATTGILPERLGTSTVEGVRTLPEGAARLGPAAFARAAVPGFALDAVRRRMPDFGSRVSVSARAGSGGALVYRFTDENGAAAEVDAATREVALITPFSGIR